MQVKPLVNSFSFDIRSILFFICYCSPYIKTYDCLDILYLPIVSESKLIDI